MLPLPSHVEVGRKQKLPQLSTLLVPLARRVLFPNSWLATLLLWVETYRRTDDDADSAGGTQAAMEVEDDGDVPEALETLKAELSVTPWANLVEGRARVDENPNAYMPGEVAVWTTTSAVHSMAFATVAAIVVEKGGALSHAATCAAELNKLCLTKVPGATQRIRTGDLVRVDPRRRIVQILERAGRQDD